jgi:hypothetical protein
MREIIIVLGLLVGCGKSGGSEPAPSKKTESPPTPEPAAAPPVLDQHLAIPALGVTVAAPACTELRITDGPGGDPPTARIGPKDPTCRALPLLGVEIVDAGHLFTTADQAKDFLKQWKKGTNPQETKLPDGYRMTYDHGAKHGVIVTRTIGKRTIACRGDGSDAELITIEAICASLAAG